VAQLANSGQVTHTRTHTHLQHTTLAHFSYAVRLHQLVEINFNKPIHKQTNSSYCGRMVPPRAACNISPEIELRHYNTSRRCVHVLVPRSERTQKSGKHGKEGAQHKKHTQKTQKKVFILLTLLFECFLHLHTTHTHIYLTHTMSATQRTLPVNPD